jgi:hypothetical protein
MRERERERLEESSRRVNGSALEIYLLKTQPSSLLSHLWLRIVEDVPLYQVLSCTELPEQIKVVTTLRNQMPSKNAYFVYTKQTRGQDFYALDAIKINRDEHSLARLLL